MNSIAGEEIFKTLFLYFLNQHIMQRITTNIGSVENISTTDESSSFWGVKEKNITKS